MKNPIRAALASFVLFSLAAVSFGAEAPKKNWTPPAQKIYAQALSDRIMAEHPELVSVTFHGTPPDAAAGVYTMYAGSFPDRIGNPDDPDDIDVIVKGITIVDPRWHKPKDAVKRFVVQLPLRDASGENIGLLVFAFKINGTYLKTETGYYVAAVELRDRLQHDIPNAAALFAPAGS